MNLAYIIILFLVLMVIVMAVTALYMRRRGRKALPDGDYLIVEEGTRETLEGTETVYKVQSPPFKGQTVVVKQAKPKE